MDLMWFLHDRYSFSRRVEVEWDGVVVLVFGIIDELDQLLYKCT